MRKKVGIIKRMSCLLLIFLLSINSFAAIVSDNDGSAFITKAEFDALKSSFQAQIDSYNQSIDSKIDGAIASYLAGIRLSSIVEQDSLLNAMNSTYGTMYMKKTWSPSSTTAQTSGVKVTMTAIQGMWYNTTARATPADHGSACRGWSGSYNVNGAGSAYKINSDTFGNYVEEYDGTYRLQTDITYTCFYNGPNGNTYNSAQNVYATFTQSDMNTSSQCSTSVLPANYTATPASGSGSYTILNYCVTGSIDKTFNRYGYLSCSSAARYCQMASTWANGQSISSSTTGCTPGATQLFDCSSWYNIGSGWQMTCNIQFGTWSSYRRTMAVSSYDLAGFHNKYCSDSAGEKVPLYGGFPLVKCTEDGKLVLKIKFHSTSSNNISAIVQKGTFGNSAPTSSTSGAINNISNNAEKEWTFPDAKKNDVYYIKMWDNATTNQDIWAETTDIKVYKEQ